MPSTDKSSADQSQSQIQTHVQNIHGSIKNWPPKVLTQILKNLDVPTLFDCRLVDRQFNEISTEILSGRREVEIRFVGDYQQEFMVVKRWTNFSSKKSASLQDFTQCMKKSKNCPFLRFSFSVFHSPKDSHQRNYPSQLAHFLSDFDVNRIKCLKINGFWASKNVRSISNFAEILKDLLMNKIPQLEEFGLEIPPFDFEQDEQKVKLFSNSNSVSSSIQLAQLKVLHFGPSMFLNYPEIVKNLLTAAVNLEKIQSFPNDSFDLSVSEFCFLHSLGKLDCLKQIDISLSAEFLSEMGEKLQNLPNLLKLRRLELFVPLEFYEKPQFWPDAGNFLSALFQSSKNTLISLEMGQLGFLHNLQWPRFTKLQKLSLYQYFEADEDEDEETYRLFPPVVKSLDLDLDIFPVVRDLELSIRNWRLSFTEHNFIPRLPNVQSVKLDDRGELELTYQIEQLASVCPNVKDLRITRGYESPLIFLQVGRTIATHLPKLKSLELFIHLDSPENNSDAFDYCFTGFSEENCKRLFDLALKKKDSDSDDKMPEFESEFQLDSDLMPEREHPSIFDMKNLNKLTVNPYFGGKSVNREEFVGKLTWISKKYGLELLPHLKLTGAEE